jgi:hypothetical protein
MTMASHSKELEHVSLRKGNAELRQNEPQLNILKII